MPFNVTEVFHFGCWAEGYGKAVVFTTESKSANRILSDKDKRSSLVDTLNGRGGIVVASVQSLRLPQPWRENVTKDGVVQEREQTPSLFLNVSVKCPSIFLEPLFPFCLPAGDPSDSWSLVAFERI